MGCYGIGIERILCAAIELYPRQGRHVLPPAIAPFDVVVTPVKYADAAQSGGAEQIYAGPRAAGSMCSRRPRRAPGRQVQGRRSHRHSFRINVGKKLPLGLVEIVDRRTHQMTEVPVAEAPAWIAERIRAAKECAKS